MKMVNVFQKKILMVAVYAAEIMMKSGAEIYRVEDTVTRICTAGRINNVEVFATPTGIFVSLDSGNENDDPLTYVKRIRSTGTNLSKISKVNSFSWEFYTTDLSVEAGMEILKDIDSEEEYPFFLRLLGAAMTCGFFALIFGGSIIDSLLAVISGVVCYALADLLKKIDLNAFIRSFCCCGTAAFIALSASMSVPDASYDPIIIGTIMLFVPGAAITNSIRDFLSGDMLSGLARMMEAVLTAVGLACGAGVILKVWTMLGGVII